MALTLDGFLPHENEILMRWVRENRRYGFPHWSQDEVQDGGSAEYADGLFPYNLVDEAVLYLLPLSYGGGIPLTGEFRSARWKLLDCKTFSNGICRMIYERSE